MYIDLHVKYPLFLFDFNDTSIFSIDIRKILKYQISRKSVRWEPSCCVQRDRQTWWTFVIDKCHCTNLSTFCSMTLLSLAWLYVSIYHVTFFWIWTREWTILDLDKYRQCADLVM